VQLSEHFTLEELIFSSTATVHGVDNTPDAVTVDHLAVTAAGLEYIRGILGGPLHIDSGYRCPELNRLVRGVPDSAHVTGYAADFTCPQFGTPLQIVQRLTNRAGLHCFDQLIQEGTWVHVSFAPPLRGEVLTAHFVDGKATYTAGA
jgi:hypothetical protein